jgi:hypothetical protein
VAAILSYEEQPLLNRLRSRQLAVDTRLDAMAFPVVGILALLADITNLGLHYTYDLVSTAYILHNSGS